ncbi:MAG: ferrous iron transport protein A [Bacilli bacterium]|nr:ferrous iron transport protein A [Bacilli bacterium]
MPLLIAPTNQQLTIKKIFVEDKLKKHLESLGISINSELRVIDNVNGNLIVIVKDVRLALDREIAGKILVA